MISQQEVPAPSFVSPAHSSRNRALRIVTAIIIGLLYFWVLGLSDEPVFTWSRNLTGYYDLLGRAFASGELHLPVKPAPELLALPNPWDENQNRPYRLLDAVLYKGEYYLYHGATPALILFTPFRLLTGHDLPERLATLLFCFGGYLFLSALLFEMLAPVRNRLSTTVQGLLLLLLGLGQPALYLLHRVLVYEVAIAAGYFCLSAGFYFFFLALTRASRLILWSGLSGLCFGLAIGCRPHLGLAAVIALAFLLTRRTRSPLSVAIALALPIAACGGAILAYNYARFGNPFEFGLRYQLGDAYYRDIRLSLRNVFPGLYYFLFAAPDLVPEFPFIRLLRQPFSLWGSVLPSRYFIEPIAGALILCPLTLVGLAAPVWIGQFRTQRALKVATSTLYLYSIGCILFLVATGLSSHRFEVDFLPFLLLTGCVFGANHLAISTGRRGTFLKTAFSVIIIGSVLANIAVAIQGPYDQYVQAKPPEFVSLAKWFSPFQEYRLLLNPSLRADAYFDFPEACPPYRLPLLSAGEFGSRYVLKAECLATSQVRLIAETAPGSSNVRSVDVPLHHPGLHNVAIAFTPDDQIMRVRWDGRVVLEQHLSSLVTSPSQVRVGWDPTFGDQTVFNRRVIVFGKPRLDR